MSPAPAGCDLARVRTRSGTVYRPSRRGSGVPKRVGLGLFDRRCMPPSAPMHRQTPSPSTLEPELPKRLFSVF